MTPTEQEGFSCEGESDPLITLLSNGWRDAKHDPPEHNRVVEVAYDDGSHGEGHLGVFDSVSGDWWGLHGGLHRYDNFIAWRDVGGER